MLTYITLGLVILKYVLDYVAPRTKTKIDDVARDTLDAVPLPPLMDAAEKAAKQAGVMKDPPKPVTGFATTSDRDHRSK